MTERKDKQEEAGKPDYLGLYEQVVHGDFYGADYDRYPDSSDESAIYYDDSEDKRTMSGCWSPASDRGAASRSAARRA
jgi:hypothetical protein